MNIPGPEHGLWDFASVAVLGIVAALMLSPMFYNKYTVQDVVTVVTVIATAGGARAIQRHLRKKDDE